MHFFISSHSQKPRNSPEILPGGHARETVISFGTYGKQLMHTRSVSQRDMALKIVFPEDLMQILNSSAYCSYVNHILSNLRVV